MGMLVNVVVADREDAAAIIEADKPVEEWKGFAAHGLDQAKFAMLHALCFPANCSTRRWMSAVRSMPLPTKVRGS